MEEYNKYIVGNFHAELYDENMVLKETKDVHNLIVAVGDAYIADCMSDRGVTMMSHMAIGDDSDPSQSCGDTILNNELVRVALDSTTQGAGADDNDVVYIATFGAGVGTGAIVEAGIFNSAVTDGGTMLCRTTFGVITKGAADTLIITWTISVGSCD